MNVGERTLSRIVAWNNEQIRRFDAVTDNPRKLDGCAWHRRLEENLSTTTNEWLTFERSGGRLPHIDDVLGEHQGNRGAWRVGVLLVGRSPTRLALDRFPSTLAALGQVPGLKAALWSVLEPGTQIQEHRGPNAGVLRYHLGIVCPAGSELRIDDVDHSFVDGEAILFDDTVPHSAWNRSAAPRATLFIEVERPLPHVSAFANRCTQGLLALSADRRQVSKLADSWNAALNPPTTIH